MTTERQVYLDHGATTPVDLEVVKAMLPYFTERFGNASSLHTPGTIAREAIENARGILSKFLNSKEDEIIFTSSGTESDNLAIKGAAFKNQDKGRHIITSSIEHPAVLKTCEFLEKHGFEVTYLPVSRDGFVSVDDVKKAIRKDTILISIMYANNEIGTIQPIAEIGKLAREKGIIFHTDAVQAVGKLKIDVEKDNIDLLSLSGHKIHGPKGVGALYKRKEIQLEPLMHGGGHEFGLRSSTENVPGIVGLGKAIEICGKNMNSEIQRMTKLRDKLIDGILRNIPDTRLNGSRKNRLPNNANITFSHIEGESILLSLDAKGISVSTGSACSSKSLKPSHVLLALGLKPEESHGSIRFTLGRFTTAEDIDYVLETLPEIVKKLRDLSPFGKK